MPRVYIPHVLKQIAADQDWVEVEGRTLGEVIDSLEAKHPGMKQRIVEDGRLAPWLSVLVDGELFSRSLFNDLPSRCEVHFLPAISGG